MLRQEEKHSKKEDFVFVATVGKGKQKMFTLRAFICFSRSVIVFCFPALVNFI